MFWIAALVWITCGVIHYGLFVAYFQGKYPLIADETFYSDRIFAAAAGLCGPVSLLATLLTCWPFNYGWRL
jgi:hypothetical protein